MGTMLSAHYCNTAPLSLSLPPSKSFLAKSKITHLLVDTADKHNLPNLKMQFCAKYTTTTATYLLSYYTTATGI